MAQLLILLELLADFVTTIAQVVVRSAVTVFELLLSAFHQTARRRFLNRWRNASTLRRTGIVAESVGCTGVVLLSLWLTVAVLFPRREVAEHRRIRWDVNDPQPTPWADRADDAPLLEVELTAQPAAGEENAAAPHQERKLRIGITRRDVRRVTDTETIPELTEAAGNVLQEKLKHLRKKIRDRDSPHPSE